MDKRRAAGAVMLTLATVAAVGMARNSRAADRPGGAQDTQASEQQRTEEEVRQTLQTYFSDHYSEAAASSVFTDLTHDGQDELLVLEMGEDRTGEPLQLHGGDLDPDRFTRARVTVLRGGAGGEVSTICEFDCGSDPADWGGLYLKTWEGAPHLLWCAPETGGGRSGFQLTLFALAQDGARRDVLRRQAPLPADGGSPGEGDALPAQAEALLADAKPVIVYSAAGGEAGHFAYLDELFTTY